MRQPLITSALRQLSRSTPLNQDTPTSFWTLKVPQHRYSDALVREGLGVTVGRPEGGPPMRAKGTGRPLSSMGPAFICATRSSQVRHQALIRPASKRLVPVVVLVGRGESATGPRPVWRRTSASPWPAWRVWQPPRLSRPMGAPSAHPGAVKSRPERRAFANRTDISCKR